MSDIIECLSGRGAPQHILAALELLQLDNPSVRRLVLLSGREREQFLQWCDYRQLTLTLGHLCNARLPDWVRENIHVKAARYRVRHDRLKRELFEIVQAFDRVGLNFIMLKGLSHSPAFTPDPESRFQGDLDFWLPGPSVYDAQSVLTGLGYVARIEAKSRHLNPMMRPSKWKWQGDLFDPEIPVSIELHYELWSECGDYIQVPGLQSFWERKKVRNFGGHQICVLCDEDLLGFAALHLLMHVLHGDLPLQRAWEIARFLHTCADDDAFWQSWRELHPEGLRQLELCVFRLVANWFGCALHNDVREAAERLPPMVRSWLAGHSLAPLQREWKLNKSELWLHLALIYEPKHKLRVLWRRLLPASLPLFMDRADSESSRLAALQRFFRQLPFLVRRAVHHAVTFFPTLAEALRWFFTQRSQRRSARNRPRPA